MFIERDGLKISRLRQERHGWRGCHVPLLIYKKG